MYVSQADLKVLWGSSGGQCSMCKTSLLVVKQTVEGYANIGEQAHMVARSEGGPRAIDGQSNDNSYLNLILLCSNCHSLIDASPEDYPVEYLKTIKTKHEQEVRDRLFNSFDNPYAPIVRNWEHLCMINNWMFIGSEFCEDGRYFIYQQFYESINSFIGYYDRISCNQLLNNYELNIAFKNFCNVYECFIGLFMKDAHLHVKNVFTVNKFYRNGNRSVDEYNDLVELLVGLFIELTRAGNHIIDMVRKHINLYYRYDTGHMACLRGNYFFGMFHVCPQYDSNDLITLPFSSVERFKARFV